MKKNKRLLCFILTIVVLSASIMLPIYADTPTNTVNSFRTIPTDIGNNIELPSNYIDNTISKFYILINVSNLSETYNSVINITQYNTNNRTVTNSITITIDLTSIYILYGDNNEVGTYLIMPYISLGNFRSFQNVNLYIPVYYRNISIDSIEYNSDNIYIALYESTSDESIIASEAFNIGYNNGYTNGYDDGFDTAANVVADLPLVEKLSTFIASFTGEDTARYITPLAICMILILIYCLFIRWVLNLARSSKLTRLTDIVVLVSCIAILLIYYIPMIDFTINQNQTVENIYRVINDVNVGG